MHVNMKTIYYLDKTAHQILCGTVIERYDVKTSSLDKDTIREVGINGNAQDLTKNPICCSQNFNQA